MQPRDSQCPICRQIASRFSTRANADTDIDCPRCGRFVITREAAANLLTSANTYRYAMSGRVRRTSELHEPPPLVQAADLDSYLSDAQVPRRISDRLDGLLLSVQRRMDRIGDKPRLSLEQDYPIAWCRDAGEFHAFLVIAANSGIVLMDTTDTPGTYAIEISILGWKRLDELQGGAPGTGLQCFVAMRFCDEMTPAYEKGMEPAIRACGYSPFRVDRVEHNNKICDVIVAELRRSRLVVADFTFNRGGVYFEAGYALGLGIPVIWTRRAMDSEEPHFDTRQYNHIEWTAPDDLRAKLQARIEVTAPLKS